MGTASVQASRSRKAELRNEFTKPDRMAGFRRVSMSFRMV
jgi:hypothetical protein